MYYFNCLLFENLGLVLGRTNQDLAGEAGVAKATWKKWLDTKDPTLAALIRICNTEHMPIAHFFLTEPEASFFGTREDYILPKATWATIMFKYSDMGDGLTVGADRTIKQACELINVSRQTFYRHYRDGDYKKDSLQVSDFIRACNLANIYPGDYLLDLNHEIPMDDGLISNVNVLQQLKSAKRRIMDLSAENTRLRTMLQRSLQQQGLTLEGYTMRVAEEPND